MQGERIEWNGEGSGGEDAMKWDEAWRDGI
jgi:hypothetical protein